MSLINDALKQARKVPPRNTPSALPPLQPIAAEPSPVFAWVLPALVILLIVAAIFFIGWAWAHHTVRTFVAAPDSSDATEAVAVAPPPEVITPRPADPPPPVKPPVKPPDAPRLQGIFYSPTSPSAIVDGKIVYPGGQYHEYKVKAISKYTVTLVGPDNKEIQIGMDN